MEQNELEEILNQGLCYQVGETGLSAVSESLGNHPHKEEVLRMLTEFHVGVKGPGNKYPQGLSDYECSSPCTQLLGKLRCTLGLPLKLPRVA